MTISLDENMIIKDIGYEYKGCPTISFTASVFTEALKGIDFEEGLKTTQKELEDINAQENCDDCIKMILVAYIAAHQNYYERNPHNPYCAYVIAPKIKKFFEKKSKSLFLEIEKFFLFKSFEVCQLK